MAHSSNGFGRFIKQAASFLMILFFAGLVGCGGGSQTYTIDSNHLSEPGAPEQEADTNADPRIKDAVVSTFQTTSARAQAVHLLSSQWTTICENRQITTLSFTPMQLTTETVFYKDVDCLEVRQDIRRKNIERYTVGAQVIDATGVVATQIHFETVLSDRYDRFVFENGVLYFGQRQDQASYQAEALDFQVPYFSVDISAT